MHMYAMHAHTWGMPEPAAAGASTVSTAATAASHIDTPQKIGYAE